MKRVARGVQKLKKSVHRRTGFFVGLVWSDAWEVGTKGRWMAPDVRGKGEEWARDWRVGC